MITVSLPADTHLGLIGGVQEREFGLWVPVEPARWNYEPDGRILASYTEEEAAIVVGMMEENHAGIE